MVRSRSRSLSPGRGRGERSRRSRSREKDQPKEKQVKERVDSFGRTQPAERKRSRSPPRRRRSRSPRRHRSRSRSPRRKQPPPRHEAGKHDDENSKPKEEDTTQMTDMDLEDHDEEVDEETAMAKMMGFSGFDTTKGKHVAGACNLSHVKVAKPRRYRQYMNRRGGFNRPLDYVS